AEAFQVYPRWRHAVVPPKGNAVALHQLQEALQDRLFQRVPGGIAVGVPTAEPLLRGERVAIVAVGRRQIRRLVLRQRGDRRPVDLPRLVERHGNPVEAGSGDVPRLALAILRLAKEETGVGMNGRLAQLAEAGAEGGLVALVEAGVALEGLAEAAGFGLG